VDQHYRQLARRMALTALAVALVPLYLFGGAIYLYFLSTHRHSQETVLRNLALNRVSAIQLFLSERTALLEALVHDTTIDDLTRSGELQKTLQLLNRRSFSFLDLGVIDSEGNHRAYVGPYRLEHRNYAEAPWFQQTMVRGVDISDVFLGFRGVPHFVVAVRNEDPARPWVLRATIDSEVFTRLVRSAQVGVSGDAYIVNRSGQYQTPPRFGGEILSTAPLDVNMAPPGINVLTRAAADGQPLLTAFAWLTDKDWLLVIDRDPREARGPLLLSRNLELITLAIGTLLITGAVLFHVRLMVRELEAQDRSRVELEAQLAHSGRLVSLGRMAAGVAHEINNPLAAIGELAGLIEDLIDDKFLKGSEHGQLFLDNVRKIQLHVDRARTVTHRMLGFARRMEPRQDTLNVNEVIEEALSFIEREAGFRSVQLTRQLDPAMPLIQSDRAQLQQVFLNLLNNALDAVADGGHIVIRSLAYPDRVEVAVEDNGTGIPREVQDRIFDPFFTTKAPGEGSGLGLSISHTIMQQLGGSIDFESELGRGTTFWVRLPRTAL
jgi:two-component system NtrC family sensor kinase